MATTPAMPAHQVVKPEDHHDENLEQILEMMEFFCYSVKPDNQYQGTLAFHFDRSSESSSGSRGKASSPPPQPLVLSIRIEGNQAQVYNGLPPDGKISAHVKCGLADFLYIYSGKASAKDILRLGVRGAIWVSNYRFNECAKFGSAINLSTPQWTAFYESGHCGTLRHEFLQGKGEHLLGLGRTTSSTSSKASLKRRRTTSRQGEEFIKLSTSSSPSVKDGGRSSISNVPRPLYPSFLSNFVDNTRAAAGAGGMEGKGVGGGGLMIAGVIAVGDVMKKVHAELGGPSDASESASTRPGSPPLSLPQAWYEDRRKQHQRLHQEGRRSSTSSTSSSSSSLSPPLFLQHLRDQLRHHFAFIPVRQQQARFLSIGASDYSHTVKADNHHLSQFEEVDCSDWWAMSRSSLLPTEAKLPMLHQVAGARYMLAKIFKG